MQHALCSTNLLSYHDALSPVKVEFAQPSFLSAPTGRSPRLDIIQKKQVVRVMMIYGKGSGGLFRGGVLLNAV
jgi:hypothetical protein